MRNQRYKEAKYLPKATQLANCGANYEDLPYFSSYSLNLYPCMSLWNILFYDQADQSSDVQFILLRRSNY